MVSYTRTGVETDVGAGTTGGTVADLPNHGVSFLSAREIYTLAPPVKGVVKTLVCTSTSTGAGTVVRCSTGTSVNIMTGSAITATQTSFALASTGGGVVQLIGVSSVRWIQAYQSVIPVTVAGIALGTS